MSRGSSFRLISAPMSLPTGIRLRSFWLVSVGGRLRFTVAQTAKQSTAAETRRAGHRRRGPDEGGDRAEGAQRAETEPADQEAAEAGGADPAQAAGRDVQTQDRAAR